MIRKLFWSLVFMLIAGLLQSAVLGRFAVFGAVPDLTLGILVYVAYANGTMAGQVTGFLSGIMLDFLSAAPLGCNMLIRTIIGAVTGLMKGRFFLDIVFLPASLCAGATLLKAVCRNLLHILFSAVPAYDFSGPVFWVEFGFSVILAPFLFALLKLCKNMLTDQGKA